MNNDKTTRNAKKIRRQAKKRLGRRLTFDEVLQLYCAAINANAPVMAEKLINIRGGITVAEAIALARFINIEADVNRSIRRVVLNVGGEEYGRM